MISGFHHEVDINCTLLSFHAASCGNFLLMLRDNLSVPPSRSRNIVFEKWPQNDDLLKSLIKLWNSLASYAWLVEVITVKQGDKEVYLKCCLL